ncbi:MAG TPA: hypothetical protein VK149_07555 [Sideroxyarcus sp.]|nr:hypothetical protein [Sideroxyarcus sp.]
MPNFKQIFRFIEIVESNRSTAILTLFGTVLAIYATFYYEKRPEITVRTDSISRVFDLYQPVGNLKIIYGNQDLRSSKKQLWAMTVTVINTGGTDIRKVDFDETVPFGLKFENAEIVDVPLLQTSDQYLKENLKMQVEANRILLSPIMFDLHNRFEISLLLLSPDGVIPSVFGAGKIAGISKFNSSTLMPKAANKNWWAMLTDADALWVQFARLVVYGFGALLALVFIAIFGALLVSPFKYLSEQRHRKKRIDQISQYRSSRACNHETQFLCEQYISRGSKALISIMRILQASKYRHQLAQQLSVMEDRALADSIIQSRASIKRNYWAVTELSNAGIYSFEGDMPKWSDLLEPSLIELADYLKIDLND